MTDFPRVSENIACLFQNIVLMSIIFSDIAESLLGVGLLTRETGQINFQLDKGKMLGYVFTT